jgi:hypothetical protein
MPIEASQKQDVRLCPFYSGIISIMEILDIPYWLAKLIELFN